MEWYGGTAGILSLLLAALFLVLTLPPFDVGWLVFVGLTPLFFFARVHEAAPQKVFWGTFAVGVIYIVKVLFPLGSLNAWWWVPQNYLLWQSRSVLLYIVLAFVAVIFGGLFFGFFFTIYRKYRESVWPGILAFPALWILLEAVRAKILFGFTWGELGYAFHNMPYFLQLAGPAKVYGLSFFALVINLLLAEALCGAIKRRSIATLVRSKFLWCALIILCGVGVYGYSVIHALEGRGTSFSSAVIASSEGTDATLGTKGFASYMHLVDVALVEHPDSIILPENTFPFFVLNEATDLPLKYEGPDGVIRSLYDELRGRSQANPATVFAIGMHSEKDGTRYNSLVLVQAGKITGIYHKRVLMPFSEDGLGIIQNPVELLAPGAKEQRIMLGQERITPLICSEVILPELSEEKGSALILNASNDSVFGSSLLAEENHIMAEMRAAENRVYLLRSTKDGIASIIDPFGRVVVRTQKGVSGVLFATIHLREK